MAITAIILYTFAPGLMGIFAKDPAVTEVGVEYLRIVVFTFVFSGVTFVTSSMFQALGNTIPSLATSGLRLLVSVIPAILLSRVAGFHLTWIWYLGIFSVVLQTTANLLLLQREFKSKLDAGVPVIAHPVGAGVGPPITTD
jgi:Na+-driven multidrug efflux pump